MARILGLLFAYICLCVPMYVNCRRVIFIYTWMVLLKLIWLKIKWLSIIKILKTITTKPLFFKFTSTGIMGK